MASAGQLDRDQVAGRQVLSKEVKSGGAKVANHGLVFEGRQRRAFPRRYSKKGSFPLAIMNLSTELSLQSEKREEFIKLVKPLEAALEASGVREGLVCVPYTTAGVTINDRSIAGRP